MAKETFNRFEIKYRLNQQQWVGLVKDIQDYLVLDSYNVNNELYRIHTLYVDTKDFHLIRESMSKPAYKEKVRIRSYKMMEEGGMVYLEIKKKYKGFVNKRRTQMLYEEALSFLKTGDIEIKPYMNEQVVNELRYIIKKYQLGIASYVSYDRMAYFSKEDPNLRITFDTNIKEKILTEEEVLLNDGWLMEIKVGDALPVWLSRLLSKHQIYKQSFSKVGAAYQHHLETIR
ncbi:MAG: polyphosphate polymerase domain-containing protein [Anaerorhabdus sp.]